MALLTTTQSSLLQLRCHTTPLPVEPHNNSAMRGILVTIPYDQIVQSYSSCRAGRIGSHNLVIGDCERGIPDYGVPSFLAHLAVPSIKVLLAVRHRVRAAL